MKSVLISIQPKWCELIALGKKTVEVRKTRPKSDTPFKCYIYETKGKTDLPTFVDEEGHEIYQGRGQVIGEFVCDEIIEFYEETLAHDELDGNPVEAWMMWNMSDNLCEVLHLYEMEDVERCTCLTSAEILSYLHPNMNGYGWHISDLVIYDKPKEINEFYRKKITNGYTTEWNIEGIVHYPKKEIVFEEIKTPPQSWCYVEE